MSQDLLSLLSSRVGDCVGDFKFNNFFGLERLVTTLERLVTTQVETLVMLDLIWAYKHMYVTFKSI